MKNLLVFLHGKGAAHNAHHNLVLALAKKYDADLLSFNAPFPHPSKPNGFMWFDKKPISSGSFMDVEQFNKSVAHIIAEIEKALQCRDCSWDNVILSGHSQGGMMAVHMGLTMNPAKVISLCGDFPVDFNYSTPVNKTVPIYWIEGGQDTILPEWRKESYRRLQEWGCNLKFRLSPHTAHDELSVEVLNLLE